MSKLNNFVLRKIRLLLSFEKKAPQVKFNAFSGIFQGFYPKNPYVCYRVTKHSSIYEPIPNYIYSRHIQGGAVYEKHKDLFVELEKHFHASPCQLYRL